VPGLRVVLVDGGSGDGSAARMREGLADALFDGWAELLALPINGGFGWANDQAMLRLLQSDQPPAYIHLLNPDSRIEPGAVAALLRALEADPRLAAAGSQLVDPGGGLAGSTFRFPSIRRELVRGAHTPALGRLLGIAPTLIPPGRAAEADWVTGASVMFRAEALRQVGLFDSGFFLYFEEIELMHRLRRAGWQVRHVPESRVLHIGGASTGVNGHDPDLVARRPAYWYRSRKRFLTLAYGRAGALLGDLAWLTGHALWTLRRLLGLGRRVTTAVPHEACDLLAHGILPKPVEARPSITRPDDPPDVPPAWMRDQPPLR
jgi:N-acetylglucosaminyl-diphospho-decaprenol L-rhamnosyltransferase